MMGINRCLAKVLLNGILSVGIFAAPCAQAETAGAKALFLGEDETLKVVDTGPAKVAAKSGKATKTAAAGAKPKYLAVMTWVKLVDETGGVRAVSPTRSFQSGERIRLSFKPNKDGYIYVVNLGSSGRASMLYPRPGQSNFVKAGQTYEAPQQGSIRFDTTPGAEQIMVVLSPQPLDKVKVAGVEVPTAGGSAASDSNTWNKFAMATGAKDLFVEDDAGGATPALYVAENPKTANGRPGVKPITVSLKLKHE